MVPLTKSPRNSHEMSKAVDTQVLQPPGHTHAELRWRLSRTRGKKVPPSTLDRWIAELCIEPNEYGLYDDDDLATLTSLVIFLKRCRSIEKFKRLLIKEISTNAC